MANKTQSLPKTAPVPTSPFTVVQEPILVDGQYILKNQTVQLTSDQAKAFGETRVKAVVVPPEPTVDIKVPASKAAQVEKEIAS